MWLALAAMVMVGPRPAARHQLTERPTRLRAVVVHPLGQAAPRAVLKLEPQEGTSSLARVLNGLELNGPVFLKPDFQGGPGAAIALKF
jgi:hypothetical protein